MAKKVSNPIPLSMIEFPEGGTIGATVVSGTTQIWITDNNTGIAPDGVAFGAQGRILISGTYRTT